MAWQNSTSMIGNGGGPVGSLGEGGNHGNQSHGTEYTLQGKSHFEPLSCLDWLPPSIILVS